MTLYVLRRFVAALVLLLVVVTVAFVILHLAPGSPVDRLIDPRIPRSQVERLQQIYGLDQPLPTQYWKWLKSIVLEGDLGYSHLYATPVKSALRRALPPTLALAVTAMLLQLVLGVTLGVASARRAGSRLDRALQVGSLTLVSLPIFWLGLMAILVLSHRLGWFPSAGAQSVPAPVGGMFSLALDQLHHLVLPSLVTALPLAVSTARLLRGSLIEVLEQDYIRAARSRGLGEGRILWRHGVKNAIGPLIHSSGVLIPQLLTGVFLIEWVFSRPGLGGVTVGAIVGRDYALVLAIVILSSALVVAGNLAADIVHGLVDPRVRQR